MSDELRGSDPLRELGKQLPYDRPDAVRRDAVRSSLLIAASEGRAPGARSRWVLVGGGFAAGALAAAAVAIVVLRPAPASAPREALASIEASPTAQLERSTVNTPTGTDERVRVRSGTVRLAVPTSRPGDHVRLVTGDAEVEGAGAYEVVVTADALARVTVASGTATVRVQGQQQAVFLAAGETWRASVVTADLDLAPTSDGVVAPPTPAPPIVAPAPAAPAVAPRPSATATATATVTATVPPPPAAIASRPAVTATPTPAPPAPPAATGSSPTETAFRAGYALLRANRYAEAAAELGTAASSEGPLASDARYFQAVALAKAGRGVDAERALVAFLDRAPTSVRRGRAAVMLARLLADRGDATSARAWFEAALGDADPAVARAARTGLDALTGH